MFGLRKQLQRWLFVWYSVIHSEFIYLCLCVCVQVADLECRVIEREEHCRGLTEELRLTKTTLHTKEGN